MRTSRLALALWALVSLITAGGCGTAVALMDAQEARGKADAVNLDNWRKVAAAQIEFVDAKLTRADADAARQIAAADNGSAIAAAFSSYLAARNQLEEGRAKAAQEVRILDMRLVLAEAAAGKLMAAAPNGAAAEAIFAEHVAAREKLLAERAIAAAELETIDGRLAQAEADLARQLQAATDRPAAAAVFAAYLGARAQLADARAAAVREYGQAVDNAQLQAELTDRQARLISGWYSLFRIMPGVETLRAVAQQKARAYVTAAAAANKPPPIAAPASGP